jgi:YbbR domain-containing protein
MPVDMQAILRATRNNRGLKVGALVLAVASWYAIHEATSFEAPVRNVRIDVLVDAGWAVLDRSVSEADVLFRGSQGDIRALDRDQVRIEVDLRGRSKDGSIRVRLNLKDVKAPRGARPVYVDPEVLVLSLDREGMKTVPVKAEFVGALPEGFEIERVSCTPAAVQIQAPRRRLAEVETVSTEPVELVGRSRSFEVNKLIEPPSETWSARMDPARTRVEVKVTELATARTVDQVRVQALLSPGASAPVRVRPTEVKISLQGQAGLINSLTQELVRAYVDCAGLRPGEHADLPVRAIVPAGLQVVGVDPPNVRADMGEL